MRGAKKLKIPRPCFHQDEMGRCCCIWQRVCNYDGVRMMSLAILEILDKKEQQILSRWQAAAADRDKKPELLQDKKSSGQFADPAGYLLRENTRRLWLWLIEPEKDHDIIQPLEEICKIKAVRQLKPTQALGFILSLKLILQEELLNEKGSYKAELEVLEGRIDAMALEAFDIYAECQARIYELRFKEIKRMYGRERG